MKTTLNLNDQLLQQARASARKRGVTSTRFVEDALRAQLMPEDEPDAKYEFGPPVVIGTKPPAVDVSNRDVLHDFMDEK